MGGTIAIKQLNKLPEAALDPVVVRAALIEKELIRGKAINGGFAVSTVSVKVGDDVQYFLAVSGQGLKGGSTGAGFTGNSVKIGETNFTIVRGNSGTIPSIRNPNNGQTTPLHEESKLFGAISDKFKNQVATVTITTQNQSKKFGGFCGGCRQTLDTFAARNTGFTVRAFQGSTKTSP